MSHELAILNADTLLQRAIISLRRLEARAALGIDDEHGSAVEKILEELASREKRRELKRLTR